MHRVMNFPTSSTLLQASKYFGGGKVVRR